MNSLVKVIFVSFLQGKVYFRPSLGGIAYLEEPFHSVDEYDVRLVDCF